MKQQFKRTRGGVAAGHPLTVKAGCDILRAGGNAIDAAVAAVFMGSVAEFSIPTIAGGGHMLVHDGKSGQNFLFDFFADMPGRNRKKIRTKDLHFKSVNAYFGTAIQEFHVGRGSSAIPGTVHGLLTAHNRFGKLPLHDVMMPAIAACKRGVRVAPIQAFLLHTLRYIVTATSSARKIYAPAGSILKEGDIFKNPDLGSTLELIAKDGIDFFYKGDFAAQVVKEIGENGGLISREDMAAYRTIIRRPLDVTYRGDHIVTNPLPSIGGRLIAFSLQLLESIQFPKGIKPNDPQLLVTLLEVMRLTNDARACHKRFTPKIIKAYQTRLREQLIHPAAHGSFETDYSRQVGNTTHVSVIDENQNAVSVTTSHGEGNGMCIKGTGIMFNNLLGEEDINPDGFHKWKPGKRLISMMAPTMLMHNNQPKLVLGSAGSNRLRSAILQTMVKLFDANSSIGRAVNGPRFHWERDELNIEPGFSKRAISALTERELNATIWPEKNLFFGGLQAVLRLAKKRFSGAGDIRRGGAFGIVD